ncbi:MAG: SHOCT domain-containing protein [Gammaproteobacteria bacterium]|nr:MAG: SHOCT domain-containing protein [Gammaproteobacteria bacterium]
MDTTDFGFWAMIIFWGTAIGGIATAITWARMKGRNPVDRELLVKSLQRRLEAGDISQDEYDKRLAELPRDGD